MSGPAYPTVAGERCHAPSVLGLVQIKPNKPLCRRSNRLTRPSHRHPAHRGTGHTQQIGGSDPSSNRFTMQDLGALTRWSATA